ncbi:MAG: type II toxin-antitoxin system RelE/ParE family toxin [Verrucomicrobiota bacterium]|nr:type II toxin-antitoxin system RelE/ParE family toxin [Verrucomicrobiota bacterium]
MLKPIVFLPDALVEASEAYAWYEEKEIGLGENFYRALSVALTYAARNPDTLIKVYENYRRVLLRRFPYAVFYEHGPEAIHIYSVFHCSQNPEKWMKRLKKS